MFSRRLGAAVLAAVALISLAGCGSKDPQASGPKAEPARTTSGTPTSGSSATPKGAANANGETDYCQRNQKPFTGPAADKFGADKVKAGYCEMVKLMMEQSFVPDLIRKTSGFQVAEFSVPGQYMTPDAKEDWDKQVAAVVADPKKNFAETWTLMFNSFDRPGMSEYHFYPDSSPMPSVMNQSFSPATTYISSAGNGKPGLGLKFTVSADIVQTDGKVPYLTHISKALDLNLSQNGSDPEKPWLIAGYRADLSEKPAVKHPELRSAG